MLGWVPFRYMQVPPEEINNPRQIYIEVWEKEKTGVIHWLDDYMKAPCGAKSWASVIDNMGAKMAVDSLTGNVETDQRWVDAYIPCPECLIVYNKSDKPKPKSELQLEYDKEMLKSEAEKQ